MPLTRTFLTWNKPFLPQLADWLAAQAEGKPRDMSQWVVVLPTRQAGRRLREALALGAAAAGTGLLAPKVYSPEGLLRERLGRGAASDTDLEASWASLLLRVDMDALRALFPVDPPRRDAVWALGLARQFATVQKELSEQGYDFASVAERCAAEGLEPERWECLAALEREFREHLGERGLADPAETFRSAVQTLPLPSGCARVVVAGLLDPSSILLALLERWSAEAAVEIVVHGDEADGLHDGWGRPLPEAVEKRELPLAGSFANLRVVKDARELSAFVVQAAKAYESQRSSLGLCIADPTLVSPLGSALAYASLPAHDPSGFELGRSPVGKLLRALCLLATDDRIDSLAVLLRDPFFGSFALRKQRWIDSPASLLSDLDEVLVSHLPATQADCLEFARREGLNGLASALAWMLEAKSRLAQAPVCEGLETLFGEILEQQTVEGSTSQAALMREALRELRLLLVRLSESERRNAELPAGYWPRLMDQALSSACLYPQKDRGAWDLQGWLEIVGESAPHLIVAGFNEGVVPENVKGDLFLPDLLRQKLGLRNNAARMRRDKLLLEAALRCRSESGRVDLLIPKLSSDGDPLQPSRLLFACDDATLVPRAKQLFSPLPDKRTPPRRTVAWRLRPLDFEPAQSLSPSAIRAYLDCPFRYYLEYALKLRPVDTAKRDLDAMDFGNLCHKAFERLAKDPKMTEVNDPELLAKHLESSLRESVAEKFGQVRSFALQIQLEAALARLRAVAEVEAVQRQSGWRTVESELTWKAEIGGYVFGGIIDRIDQHLDGRWRVIDYKTGDKGTLPDEAHLGSCPKEHSWLLPEAVWQPAEGRPRRWLDLQLPLYLLALRANRGIEARAGYFVLPRTKEDTAIHIWEDLSPDQLRAAESCAVAVARAIANRRFWPPAPKPRWRDELARLFPDGVDFDADAEAFAALERSSR